MMLLLFFLMRMVVILLMLLLILMMMLMLFLLMMVVGVLLLLLRIYFAERGFDWCLDLQRIRTGQCEQVEKGAEADRAATPGGSSGKQNVGRIVEKSDNPLCVRRAIGLPSSSNDNPAVDGGGGGISPITGGQVEASDRSINNPKLFAKAGSNYSPPEEIKQELEPGEPAGALASFLKHEKEPLMYSPDQSKEGMKLGSNPSQVAPGDDILKVHEDQRDLLTELSLPTTLPSSATSQTFEDHLQRNIINADDIEVSFYTFPYYLSEIVKKLLLSVTDVHLKAMEFIKYINKMPTVLEPRILLSGPVGCEIYQKTLVKALAKDSGARLLIVDSLSLPGVDSLGHDKWVGKDAGLQLGVRMLFEVVCEQSKKGTLILFLKNIETFIAGNANAYCALKHELKKLPSGLVVIGSCILPDDQEKSERRSLVLTESGSVLTDLLSQLFLKNEILLKTNKQLGRLFPNEVSVRLPQGGAQLSKWKQQLGRDAETLNEESNIARIKRDINTENEFEEEILADVTDPCEIGVTFDDIGALESVKDTLEKLVMLPLRRPDSFSKGQQLEPCKGILLFGPPGSGKTMLAKAVATEARANLIDLSASTITAKHSGEAEKYVKAVFSLASKLAPCVISVNEVDGILGKGDEPGENDGRRRVKAEFLAGWDGLRAKEKDGVLVLASTDRPFDLDDAMLMRFSERLMVNIMDADSRSKILKSILAKEELSSDVDIDAMARLTDGYSASDLKDLCVAAAHRPIKRILDMENEEKSMALAKNLPIPPLRGSADIGPINMDDLRHAHEKIVCASVSLHSAEMKKLIKWNEAYGL